MASPNPVNEEKSAEQSAADASAKEISLLKGITAQRSREIAELEAALTIARSVAEAYTKTPSPSRFVKALQDASPEVVAMLGTLALSVGAGMIYRPAGLIVLGALLLCGAVLSARPT